MTDNVAKYNPAAAAYMDEQDARLQAKRIEENYYSRSAEAADQATADFFSEEAEREAAARRVIEKYNPPEEDVQVVPAATTTLVYGLNFDEPELTDEQKEAMADMVFSYIGVTPRKIDQYVGRWVECLGCCVAPLSAEVTTIDSNGEPHTETLQWDAPLFKLSAIDDITQTNVIITGGGSAGKKFARTWTAIKGPGDWEQPRMIFISQEGRQGIDRETGQLTPRRLYRFMSKLEKPTTEDKKRGKQ